ncbi:uncharacterized protein [Littorina saxatilis]|uniref:uncharacterized protein n=1 Tax=Littorina saxatilis TaxID=31220 RepID=UPI0038B4B704
MSAPTPDDTSKMRCTETDDSTNQKNAGTDDASKDSTLAAGGKEKGALDTEEDATTGIRGEIVVVNGEKFHKLPLSISTEEHLNNLKNMRMRHDDIIIAAFPKSGE